MVTIHFSLLGNDTETFSQLSRTKVSVCLLNMSREVCEAQDTQHFTKYDYRLPRKSKTNILCSKTQTLTPWCVRLSFHGVVINHRWDRRWYRISFRVDRFHSRFHGAPQIIRSANFIKLNVHPVFPTPDQHKSKLE